MARPWSPAPLSFSSSKIAARDDNPVGILEEEIKLSAILESQNQGLSDAIQRVDTGNASFDLFKTMRDAVRRLMNFPEHVHFVLADTKKVAGRIVDVALAQPRFERFNLWTHDIHPFILTLVAPSGSCLVHGPENSRHDQGRLSIWKNYNVNRSE
jgi:hypothetical protein